MKRLAALALAAITLAACGRGGGYEVIPETTPAPTTTYISPGTEAVRAWWDSLDDLQKLSACDLYSSYLYAPGGSEQAFVDWAMTQGANEVQAWTLAGVLGEVCVGRM